MIKSLKNAQIADGLPRILGEQPWVKALSMAMLELHQKTMGYIAGSQIYTAIDTVAEEVLDALAVNWKIDWYDTGYDIEQKRRIVKTALNIRRTMDFNPRAPCGARRTSGMTSFALQVFQSTRPVRGATSVQAYVLQACEISIHAPRAGRDAASPA